MTTKALYLIDSPPDLFGHVSLSHICIEVTSLGYDDFLYMVDRYEAVHDITLIATGLLPEILTDFNYFPYNPRALSELAP